ncbi:patatin-like phospholipase family protein [Rhodobacter sp. NTK016B]|uniref:patatin-like phospholipase family protein n=1 Tax=Rhodobacter sp. NTK016B TaxID=2759676 RepID=UPI001A8D87BD|nr:patatin-like phospholipase family protein [Rhodobacter sp. NTK016B]MBN8293834.1 patatin-like phospholipase family protein [Rhodobacter sp. NTK016B]
MAATARETKRINLALQGGGAHGALTWGVLDRLLDEEWLEIAAISGTSAGALNGAAFKAGYAAGGREGARETLAALWDTVGRGASDLVPGFAQSEWTRAFFYPLDVAISMSEALMPFTPVDLAAQVFSPYDWAPFLGNPLEPAVRALDIDNVCAEGGPALFVAATNTHTGKVRVFGGAEVTHQAILASACLPTFFRAVEIDGESYWDGGYSANPALFPLYDKGLPDDIIIVSLNPLYRPVVPETSQDILNRINEISFNAALLSDLRAIAFVKRLLARGAIEHGVMKDVLVHIISDDDTMRGLSARTKMAPNAALLEKLFDAGRTAADRFLRAHRDDLGTRTTVDLQAMFR